MRIRPRPPKAKRNVLALELWTPKFRPRRVAAGKGAGSYRPANNRRPDARQDGGGISGAWARAAAGRPMVPAQRRVTAGHASTR